MRRHFSGRPHAACARARRCSTDSRAERCIRWTLLTRLGREVDVPRDHEALAERRPAAEPELGGDRSGMRMASARQRRLFAVHRDRAARDGVVLERAPHHARRRDRAAVVGEPDRAGVGERAHLRQLVPGLSLRDRCEEPDRDARLDRRTRAQPAHHLDVVDDGIGVRHREDRAVAACGRRSGARRDRLLVLAAGVRRCTCGSTNAGTSVRPAPSTTRCSFVSRSWPIWAITPPSMRTSSVSSTPSTGSRTRAPRTTTSSRPSGRDQHHATPTAVSTATGPGGEQVVEHRHADDEPRTHLVDDERGFRVGDARVDLDAAVHRARDA